ncbi:hypothetical protein [Frigoribacterium sp. UYMn621]|uniref:hypothetical protein n=1 Tax=Frigoribacterium sp. UYMn621 TaxID=3156343 RepID=UPI0033934993
MKRVLVPVMLAAIMTLAGCAHSTALPRSEQPLWGITVPQNAPISSAQRGVLADGTVTNDEYQASFRRFSACLAKGGFVVMENDAVNEVIQYGVPAAASKLNDSCYTKEFQWVDGVWQASREDTSNQAKSYGVCLTEKGITPKKTEEARYEQLQQAHIDAAKCYKRVYPQG